VTLEDRREDRLGINVAELYDAVEAYLAELKDRRKPGASFFDRWLAPKIRYAKLKAQS
jgi:predicted aminopeptidase